MSVKNIQVVLNKKYFYYFVINNNCNLNEVYRNFFELNDCQNKIWATIKDCRHCNINDFAYMDCREYKNFDLIGPLDKLMPIYLVHLKFVFTFLEEIALKKNGNKQKVLGTISEYAKKIKFED